MTLTFFKLGAFGFISGPTLTSDGVGNAGLLDQRAALQWTKDYISLVGGNPAAITAMGESAGAGSIMHHLVAQGGTLDPIFTKAVMQSPAFEPLYDPGRLLLQYQIFEKTAGCGGKGLACLRSASTTALQTANKKTINNTPYGTFGYGPSVDGSFIRDIPGLEMARGNYWKNVKVMAGHTSYEGIVFTDPSINTESEITTTIQRNFPNATAATRNLIQNELYPKPGFLGLFTEFSTNFERLSTIIQDFIINCNVLTYTPPCPYLASVLTWLFLLPGTLDSRSLPRKILDLRILRRSWHPRLRPLRHLLAHRPQHRPAPNRL